MVITFRHYAPIISICIRSSQQHNRFFNQHGKRYLSNSVLKNPFIRSKFLSLMNWYDEFTGMDEVRAAQKRVLEDEENFRKSQASRREMLNKLTEIQQKLKDLYVELENTQRGDERYVALVTQEHKLLKEEKRVLEEFKRAETIEREAFAALSSSVKMSHEKERAQSERTKYWSIIGSVLGTVLGLLGSSVSSYFKMRELKELIKNSSNVQLLECLNNYVEKSEEIIENYKKAKHITDKKSLAELEKTLTATNKRLTEVESSLRNIVVAAKHIGTSTEPEFVEASEFVRREYFQIKFLLLGLAVLSVVMPIVSR